MRRLNLRKFFSRLHNSARSGGKKFVNEHKEILTVTIFSTAIIQKNTFSTTLPSNPIDKLENPYAVKQKLLYAAKNNKLEEVIELLDKDPSLALTARTERYGNTPFHCAALRGHLDIVKYFVNNSEKFNLPIDQLLMIAAKFGQTNIIEYLLTQNKQTLDAKQVDRAFVESISYSADANSTKCFLQYRRISKEAQNQALLIAARNSSLEHIKILYQYGKVDLLAKSISNFSALEAAISLNCYEVITCLIYFSRETDKEIIINAYYNARKYYLEPNPRLSQVQQQFHKKMQNPIDGVIHLSTTDFGRFRACTINEISMYFVPVLEGNYFIKDKFVHTLDFSFINLGERWVAHSPFSGSSNPRSPASPYYLEVCDLIASNINISTLNLSNTNLNDNAVEKICDALKKNTHLKEININFNPRISDKMRNKLKDTLKNNKSNLPVAVTAIGITLAAATAVYAQKR